MARYLIVLICILPAISASAQWKSRQTKYVDLQYTTADDTLVKTIIRDVEQGVHKVEEYFGVPFAKRFQVDVLPGRHALDSLWQTRWNEPTFTSQCWMVASGGVTGLHLLSPRVWSTEACEHDAANSQHVANLITHEVVHVYHGQFTVTTDLDELESIGWFVEGLATLVSGQLNDQRLRQVKQVIAAGKNPVALEDFWSGKARYGQCGYLVAYIEKTKGRKFLFELLTVADEDTLLKKLGTTEAELIDAWKKYVNSL